MSETLWLQPTDLAPARARRWLGEWCSDWGCTDIGDDAVLLVSELTTNATRHARTTITVSARFSGQELRVAVADRQPGDFSLAVPDRSAETGRGLPIVAALADEWGVHSHRGGKFVWFTLMSANEPVCALAGAGRARPVRRGALSARR